MANISDRLVKELEKNPEANLSDIKLLQEWCKSKKIPQLKDFEILQFHHSCLYDIEHTKKCIETYFKIRISTPELFTKRYVDEQPLKDYMSKILQCFPLGATKDGYQIIFSRLLSDDPSIHSFTLDLQQLLLATELLLYKIGTFPGVIILNDYNNLTVQHILSAKWSHIRVTLRYMQEAFPVRLRSVELLSASTGAEYGLAAIRPFTSSDILNKITLHKPINLSTLHQKIPIENLPKEYGGLLPSCDDILNDYLQEVTAMKSYFDDKDAFEKEYDKTNIEVYRQISTEELF